MLLMLSRTLYDTVAKNTGKSWWKLLKTCWGNGSREAREAVYGQGEEVGVFEEEV
jgi:hypothetical protein